MRDFTPYIAGVVAADGHLYSREVRIGTSEKIFLRFLRTNLERLGYNPRIEEGRRVWIVRIYSTQLRKVLTNLYAIPIGKKAQKIIFPTWLEKRKLRHYVAGFFDGDGSISVYNSGTKGDWGPYKTIRITFTSKSRRFLAELRTYLKSLGLTPTSVKKEKEVYRLKMYSLENLKLFRQLFTIRHPVKLSRMCSVLQGELVP